ncbi:hypothetical protein BH09PSE5_BH09PSE5_16960 [soil metagenome]
MNLMQIGELGQQKAAQTVSSVNNMRVTNNEMMLDTLRTDAEIRQATNKTLGIIAVKDRENQLERQGATRALQNKITY